MLLAEAVGLPPAKVAYRRHDGGGDQIQSGQLRALAVTSEEPVRQVPAPTVRSAGFDIVFHNWRGLVAPPESARVAGVLRRLGL